MSGYHEDPGTKPITTPTLRIGKPDKRDQEKKGNIKIVTCLTSECVGDMRPEVRRSFFKSALIENESTIETSRNRIGKYITGDRVQHERC
jgi:hypothetical protein